MRRVTLPIFIPELGCTHHCLFCNQHVITEATMPTPADIAAQITTYLTTCPANAHIELAFFGGSFTLLPRKLLVAYLSAAAPFLAAGKIHAIRCSTRPDGITDDILSLLQTYHVTIVELGVQSMSDTVLSAVCRGHTADDSRTALQALRGAGIASVGQMMLGLPLADLQSELDTARELVAAGVSAVRIYPLVVLPHTALAKMQADGRFVPLSHAQMVARGAEVLAIFADAGIPVLRIGLCANETLDALPPESGFHPAIGECIRAALYETRIRAALAAFLTAHADARHITVLVPRGAASQAAGQHGATKRALAKVHQVRLTIRESDTLLPYHIQLLDTV